MRVSPLAARVRCIYLLAPALSGNASEHSIISNIASQSRRKLVGELMVNGGICEGSRISALWTGAGVVGEFSR